MGKLKDYLEDLLESDFRGHLEIEVYTEDGEYAADLCLYDNGHLEIFCDEYEGYKASEEFFVMLLESKILADKRIISRTYDESSFWFETDVDCIVYLKDLFYYEHIKPIIEWEDMSEFYRERFGLDDVRSLEAYVNNYVNNCVVVFDV